MSEILLFPSFTFFIEADSLSQTQSLQSYSQLTLRCVHLLRWNHRIIGMLSSIYIGSGHQNASPSGVFVFVCFGLVFAILESTLTAEPSPSPGTP